MQGIYNNSNFDRGTLAKYHGFSIRCLNDNAVGIDYGNGPNFEFQIYPNPSSGKLFVECGKSNEYRLQVIDIFGKTVDEKQIYESSVLEIESKGIYFIRLMGNSKMMTQKVIIQ